MLFLKLWEINWVFQSAYTHTTYPHFRKKYSTAVFLDSLIYDVFTKTVLFSFFRLAQTGDFSGSRDDQLLSDS